MMRVVLFLVTNLAVMLVLSIVMRFFGVESILAQNGVDLDLRSLLIFSAVFGMGGSFISLALSKFMAKRATGAKVITEPANDVERWLVQTVGHQAQAAGIGMPEVAIFPSDAPNAFATGARKDAALVAVSTGLLRSMKREEVEAVLGHEVTHVANGDMVTLALIQGVVNTFVIFLSRVIGHVVDRVILPRAGHASALHHHDRREILLAPASIMWPGSRGAESPRRGGARLPARRHDRGAER